MRSRTNTFLLLGLFGLLELVLCAVLVGRADAPTRADTVNWLLIGGMILVPLLALGALSILHGRQGEALARSEQRADLALSGAKLAYFDVDVETGRGIVNARWHELLGTRPQEVGDAIHNTWVAMLHPDDRQRVLEVGRRYKDGELDHYTVEYRCVTRQGAIRWFTSSGMLVRQQGRQRMVGVFQDVTSRKESEAALREAKDEAEEASRVKSRFLANISHDIRTPMNGIIGLADVLLAGQLDALQRAQVELLKESALSLLDIINNILDYSRIEACRFQLNIEPASIREAVHLTIQPLAPLAQAKYLELAAEVADDIPDTLKCDSLRLRQVLGNLAGNAIKFTDDGRVAIKVARLAEDAARVRLEFSVVDSGIGIEPGMQPRVFEAFRQIDSKHVRRHGGSGLGLSIAAQLVNLMGGEIKLESAPGRGSTFRFAIDLDKVAQDSGSKAVMAREHRAGRP